MKKGFYIRQMLNVPVGFRHTVRRSPKGDTVPHFGENDAWAQKRARELNEAGISASVQRFRKNESLCVVYKLS